MANECLVTKLKGNVANDKLIKVGEINLHIRKVSDFSEEKSCIRLLTSEEVNVRVSNGGYFATTFAGLNDNRLTNLTLSPGNLKYLYFPNENFEVFISNKYAISTFEIIPAADDESVLSFNLDDLLFNQKTNMSVEMSKDSTGNISKIANNSVIKFLEITNYGAALEGDLAGLSSQENLLNLNLGNSNVYGDISNLAKSTSLNRMLLRNTKVHGTIEEFVAGQVANGRTEVTNIVCWYILTSTNVTFGGQHFSGADNLKWENSGNKIIMCDESTIEAANRIWAKGATASEIAEWEQASKTVVVVS